MRSAHLALKGRPTVGDKGLKTPSSADNRLIDTTQTAREESEIFIRKPEVRDPDAAQQKEQYSGKKKTHTDKNLLLVNEHTTKVVYLGPTVAGKMHDKKAADTAQIAYPVNATLDKDTGFQGYEPAGVLTQQPKKSPQARS